MDKSECNVTMRLRQRVARVLLLGERAADVDGGPADRRRPVPVGGRHVAVRSDAVVAMQLEIADPRRRERRPRPDFERRPPSAISKF